MNNIYKILVVQPMSFGDVFLMTAIVDGLKKKHKADIDFMTKSKYQTLLLGNKDINRILTYPNPSDSWRVSFDLLLEAKQLTERYDKIYTPYHATQIRFDNSVELFNSKTHIVEVYAKECGLKKEEIGVPFILPIANESITDSVDLNKKTIIIHPYTEVNAKRYDGFSDLIHILREMGYFIIQAGTKKDRIYDVDFFIDDFHELAELCIIHNNLRCIAIDSVIGHIVSSLGVNTISLFGGTTSSFCRPYWGINTVIEPKIKNCNRPYGCHAYECEKNNKCINLITIKEIIENL